MTAFLEEQLGRRIPTKELAEWLGLDVDAVRRHYQAFGGIRPIPKGKILFFERNVVDALTGSNHGIEDTEGRSYSLEGAGPEDGPDQTETLQHEGGCRKGKARQLIVNPLSPVTSLTPGKVLAALRAQFGTRSGNALNKDRKNLVAAWNWGVKYLGLPMPNPCLVERFPEERHPRYIPSEEDFWKVYAQACGQDHAPVLFASGCKAFRNLPSRVGRRGLRQQSRPPVHAQAP